MTRWPTNPASSNSSDRIGAEQRRAGRTLYRKTFLIHPLDRGVIGPAIATRAHDFSSVGVGLIHSGRMHKGTQFVVPLATQAGPPVLLLYAVAHCRSIGNGLFGIGAELVSVLDSQDFYGKYPDGQTFADYMRIALGAKAGAAASRNRQSPPIQG